MPGFRSKLQNMFARFKKPKLSADALKQRIDRVAESILENEALTADLDDSAANELLEWGLTRVKEIAQGTADLDDDEEAEQAMYPQLRATRRLMRSANRWVAREQQGDAEGSAAALSRILDQAAILYGRAFTPPTEEQRTAFLESQAAYANDPPRLIANLRQLLEHPEAITATPEGEGNDQEDQQVQHT